MELANDYYIWWKLYDQLMKIVIISSSIVQWLPSLLPAKNNDPSLPGEAQIKTSSLRFWLTLKYYDS